MHNMLCYNAKSPKNLSGELVNTQLKRFHWYAIQHNYTIYPNTARTNLSKYNNDRNS